MCLDVKNCGHSKTMTDRGIFILATFVFLLFFDEITLGEIGLFNLYFGISDDCSVRYIGGSMPLIYIYIFFSFSECFSSRQFFPNRLPMLYRFLIIFWYGNEDNGKAIGKVAYVTN